MGASGGGPEPRYIAEARADTESAGIDGVIAIAGGDTSLALKADGTVWEWDETALVRPLPVQVSGLSGVVAVAVGAPGDWGTLPPHRLALKDDGTVWAWGHNASGQLGDGTTASRGTPVQVGGISGVRSVAAAGYHSYAVRDDGTVWGWGENGNGELGDGAARSTPVQVIQPGSPDLAIAMRHDGDFTVGGQGVYTLTIANVGGASAQGGPAMGSALSLLFAGDFSVRQKLICPRSGSLGLGTTFMGGASETTMERPSPSWPVTMRRPA